MSHVKEYFEVKDSEVHWLGHIPSHWDLVRIKWIAKLRKKRQTEVSSSEIYIGLEDVESATGRYKPTEGDSRQTEDSTVAVFQQGDVLYGKLRPYLRKTIVADTNGTCSTEFLVLNAHGVIPDWLQQWLLTPEVTHQIQAGCEGAKMPRADWEHIGATEIALPTIDEQKLILNSLSKEAIRTDNLIQKKIRFIELLKEKRQALITHSVTTGIETNASLQESGIKWVEQVPSHWEVVPSIWLFAESKETAHEDDQHLSATQKYGVIPLSEYERLENRQVTHAIKNLEKRKHVKLDDFVISMRSFQGGIERVKARGCVRSSYVVLKASEEADVDYFAYLFKSSAYIQGLQATSSFIRDGQDLNYGNFRQVKLPKPPLEEQKRIAQYLNQQIARIDALIEKTQHSVALLTERRAAFITAAVTGQIDLRGEE